MNDAFRDCLGGDFGRLPGTIRNAHTGKIRLSGTARVTRGNVLAKLIADAMGLPPASDSVAMSVEGEHLPGCMLWDRRFGEKRFRSCFKRDGDALVESVGPFRLRLRLAVQDGKLRYLLERVRLLGLPWPRALAPSLEAWEGERAGRYDFAVEVRLPLLGRLVRYEGLLDLHRQRPTSSRP